MTISKKTKFQLEEATFYSIQDALKNNTLTSYELVSLYLERIACMNQVGPALHAVIEINPDALHLAEAMDEERRRIGPRSTLHGIPILLKDNIDTRDAMHTSAGSLALQNSFAADDAFLVKKLREAGAIILGKTNMTEWANFMTENMPNGYSSRGGQVRNPYGPERFDVSGSSSGSGAAVAANFAGAAIGTETSGSILCPAAANGIVGIKPTVGLISRSGIIPISSSQDTAGPMARTVTDAAILLGALTGIDTDDSATFRSASQGKEDYTPYLDASSLSNARIGVVYEYCVNELSPSQKKCFDEAISVMKKCGAEVVRLDSSIQLDHDDEDFNVLLYEFKSGVNQYLSKLNNKNGPNSLSDVIAFNKQHDEECLRYGQVLLERSNETSGTLTEATYLKSRISDLKKSRELGMDLAIRENRLDAILYPNDTGYGLAAKAGYPSITIPAGKDHDGRPFGIVLTSGAFQEPKLISLGYAFEQATNFRTPPIL